MKSLVCSDCGGDYQSGHSYDCLRDQVYAADRTIEFKNKEISELESSLKDTKEHLEAEERWKIKNGRELPEQILFPLYRTSQELAPHIGVSVGGLFDTHATARYLLEGTNLLIDGKPVERKQ